MTKITISKLNKTLALASTLTSALAACGGGGGGLVTGQLAPPPPPPPPFFSRPDADFETINSREFRRQASFAQGTINILPAFEAGITGEGVLVGHIDTGIDANHPALRGKIHQDSTNVARPFATISELPDGVHGTWTAGIIIAAKDGLGMHGVAYDATIIHFATDTGVRTGCRRFVRCGLSAFDVATAINLAVDSGARVLSLSMAQEFFPNDELANAIQRAVDAGVLLVVSAGNQYLDNPLPFPGRFAMLPGIKGGMIVAGATDLNNVRSIWKPNLVPNDLANPFANVGSNAAGYAQDVTLFAPGTEVNGPWTGDTYILGNGTSGSAPLIAGAAALLFQAFPQLTGREVAQILFESAVDLGAVGDDIEYGQGLLNIGAALAPAGVTTMMTSAGLVMPISGSVIDLAPAFGDALSSGGSLGILMQDKYQRTYTMDLGANVQPRGLLGINFDALIRAERAREGISLPLAGGILSVSYYDDYKVERGLADALPMAAQSTMRYSRPSFYVSGQLDDNISLAGAYGMAAGELLERTAGTGDIKTVFMIAPAFSDTYLGYGESRQSMGMNYRLSDVTTLAAATTLARYEVNNLLFDNGHIAPNAVLGEARLSHQRGKLNMRLDIGALSERGAILGSQSSGALTLGAGASTVYGRLEASYRLDSRRTFFAFASHGMTSTAALSGSLIDSLSGFRTSSFAFGYVQRGLITSGDMIGIAISQPLRVESGTFSATLPTDGFYYDASLRFTQSSASLSPSGREIDVELSYRWQAMGLNFSSSIMAMRNTGHVAANGFGFAGIIRAVKRY